MSKRKVQKKAEGKVIDLSSSEKVSKEIDRLNLLLENIKYKKRIKTVQTEEVFNVISLARKLSPYIQAVYDPHTDKRFRADAVSKLDTFLIFYVQYFILQEKRG